MWGESVQILVSGSVAHGDGTVGVVLVLILAPDA